MDMDGYGEKLWDKENFTANQLKKSCKKKYFQGIHDRFTRDPEFCDRMIENHRDEEHCRRWDAFADEDHTHHLTTQEYSLCRATGDFIQRSKVLILCRWRTDLISNKRCPPCIDRNKKKKETHKCFLTLTEINNGHRVLLPHGGIGKVHGGLLIPLKVTMEMHQVLKKRSDLLNDSIWKDSSGQDFLEFNQLCYR